MPPSDQEPRYQLVDPSTGDVVGSVFGDGNGNVVIADETDTQTTFDSNGVTTPALKADGFNSADLANAASGTAPIAQGDGTLAMQTVNTDTEIDLIDVEAVGDLPDLSTLQKPTIAYIDSENDYVGAFKP